MDRGNFFEWLENPTTQFFFKYLKDSAKQESEFITGAIMNGEVVPLDDQIRLSTLSMTLIQISEISFDEIDTFYKK